MFNLTGLEISHFLMAMACLLALAHILGYLAELMLIPRVIGEVSAGLILGPSLLGYFFPDGFHWMFLGFPFEDKLFGLVYQIGLIMLMFSSGLKFQTRFKGNDVKIVLAIIIGSTLLPFMVGWLSTSMFHISAYLGTANNLFAMKIIVAISIAVTSIPVISKIFYDLGIIHSRFAKLVVAIAGVHDILLWVALGIATSISVQGGAVSYGSIGKTLLITAAFIVGSLLVVSFLFKHLTLKKTNILFRSSYLGYFLFIMFIVSALAGYLHVETIFGALLAGIAAKISLPQKLFQYLEQGVTKLSFSWFIPVYFATVGLQLDLAHNFDILFFLKYLLFATLAQAIFVYIASRLIGLDHLTSTNFGVAMNARGGPGIVLSTVAYSTGIINQEFFAILVMLALVTSWFAGSWLRIVINKGWRLMPGDENLVPKRLNEENFQSEHHEHS